MGVWCGNNVHRPPRALSIQEGPNFMAALPTAAWGYQEAGL